MDLSKLLEAIVQFQTTGKFTLPTYWTLGALKIPVNVIITQNPTTKRLEFSLAIPELTVPL